MGGGLIGELPAVLAYALNEGFVATEISVRKQPYDGVQRSAKNAVITGINQGIAFGLMLYVSEKVIDVTFGRIGSLDQLASGVFVGLLLAPIFGLEKGGGFWIRHWLTRFLLWRRGSAPLRYLRFLNYACECVFLRRIGGGYVFVHRMLLEHFASQPILTKK